MSLTLSTTASSSPPNGTAAAAGTRPAPSAAPGPAPVPPTAQAPRVTLLLETDELLIEHSALPQPSDTVVVTFDPILWETRAKPFAVDFLLKCGADTISVRKKSENFFQPLTRSAFDAAVAPVLSRYRRRLAYGSSLGAYAVLYFCREGYDHVVSSSPRVSAHPRYGTAVWQKQTPFRHEGFDPKQVASSPATVFYDPLDPQDQRFVEHEIRRGWPHAHYVPLRYAGHPANQFLSEIGFITPYIRALVQGLPPPVLDRRLKSRSGIYHLTLAMACLARGKLNWTQTLAQRALELAPYLDLARRTLAEVDLARGDFERAEAGLNDYRQRQPNDASGPHLLTQLGQRRAQAQKLQAQAEAEAAAQAAAQALREARRQAEEAAAAQRAAQANDSSSRWPRWWVEWLGQSDSHVARQARRLARRWRQQRAGGSGVSRDDVHWAFRHFLGREPESEQAVQSHMHLPSQRALVQTLLESTEYQLRQQQRAGTGSAVRKGAYGRGGPEVLVVGNCQAPGLAAALASGCAVKQAQALTGMNLSTEAFRQQLQAQASRADLWFVNPANTLAREVFAEKAKTGARLVTVPALQFNAFHPDVCYAHHRATQQLTQQHYNSAIAAWAYTQGLNVAQTSALFNASAYQGLGYFDAWPRAMEHLRRSFDATDLKPHFGSFALRLQRQGCFMHTPNHPGLGAQVLLARLAAQQAGLELLDEPVPGELTDGLASTIWPVYPEIARALALDGGSHTWKFVGRNSYVRGLQAYVEQAFRSYAAQGITPADLELRALNLEQLDAVLRPLVPR